MGDHSDKAIFYEPIDHSSFREKYPDFDTTPIYGNKIGNLILMKDLYPYDPMLDRAFKKSRLLRKATTYGTYFTVAAIIGLIIRLTIGGVIPVVLPLVLALIGLALAAVGLLASLARLRAVLKHRRKRHR